jgi:hypothetical protein
MKRRRMLFSCVVTVLFGSLAGCASSGESLFKPHKEGYEVVTVSRHRDLMHEYQRGEIYYWDKNGKKTLIWRYRSNQFLYTNDLALFHGYLTTGPDDPGGATRRGVERLFAVQGSGPPVDITEDVVLVWAQETGTNSLLALKTGYIASLQNRDDVFQVRTGFRFGAVGTVELDRDALLKIIREAQQRGKLMKDPGFGTPYFKRDWEAELNKQ